jgi:hypothetical protein
MTMIPTARDYQASLKGWALMLCEACERGDHASCNLASWCTCDNSEDGDELAGIADILAPSVEDIAASREELDRAQLRFAKRVNAALDSLTPTEQSILDCRLPGPRQIIRNRAAKGSDDELF